jgi:hypothetical protein
VLKNIILNRLPFGFDLNATAYLRDVSRVYSSEKLPCIAGKTLFAEIMNFIPWTSFGRIVARYHGNARVRTLPCTEQFRVMAFAQITWQESLRNIEACLFAQSAKLYHIGLTKAVARSTLVDANESRDWRIWARR